MPKGTTSQRICAAKEGAQVKTRSVLLSIAPTRETGGPSVGHIAAAVREPPGGA